MGPILSMTWMAEREKTKDRGHYKMTNLLDTREARPALVGYRKELDGVARVIIFVFRQAPTASQGHLCKIHARQIGSRPERFMVGGKADSWRALPALDEEHRCCTIDRLT